MGQPLALPPNPASVQGQPGTAFHWGSGGSMQSVSPGCWDTHPATSAAHAAFGEDQRKAAAAAVVTRKGGSSPRYTWSCRHAALQSTDCSSLLLVQWVLTHTNKTACPHHSHHPLGNSPCPGHPSTASFRYVLQGRESQAG